MKATRDASPQALHHFTQADQVNQLVGASEADPDLGFMARLMVLCCLPRPHPGSRIRYIRQNGPYTLVMTAGGKSKLPFGNFPRLLLAWVCTEVVRTQSRELILGRSLSKFMRALGVYSSSGGTQTRLRNQMRRVFNAHVQLIYEDELGEASVSSSVADRTDYLGDTSVLPSELAGAHITVQSKDGQSWTTTVTAVLDRSSEQVIVTTSGRPETP